jgi:hypothetical protein
MMDSYTLTFENRDSYLYAHLAGQDSFGASLSYWNKIADKVKELDSRKLLVHEALTGEVTETEIYDIIIDLVGSGLQEIRIAFYDENHDDIELNALGQFIAQHRGANIKIFHSLKAAERWIKRDD